MSILELGFLNPPDPIFRLLNDDGDTDTRDVIFDWIRRTDGVAVTGTITDAAFDAASNEVSVTFPFTFENLPFMELWLEGTDGRVTDCRNAGWTEAALWPTSGSPPTNTLKLRGMVLSALTTTYFTIQRRGIFGTTGPGSGNPATSFYDYLAKYFATDTGAFYPATENVPQYAVRWIAYYSG